MTSMFSRAMSMTALAVALSAAPAVVPPLAADEKAIHLVDPWARRAPAMGGAGHGAAAGGGNGAVYVKIVNHGASADAVVSASSDAAGKVELHEVVSEQGVMKMRPMAKFTVPAKGALEMKPGGYHVMLLGLTRDLKPGDKVKVTLNFEKAGPMVVEAPVR